NLKPLDVKDYQNLTGKGLVAKIGDAEIAVISPGAMKANKISFDEKIYDQLALQGKTVVFVLKDNVLQGMIALADIIRESYYKVIKELNDRGIEKIIISGVINRDDINVVDKYGFLNVI